MGRDRVNVTISGSVSRHNSPRDRFDYAAWDWFLDELDDLMSRPEYKTLGLER